jgi:hypothetical protein
MICGFPDEAEVFLRVLTAEGARQVALIENPPVNSSAPTAGNWWDVAVANSQVFTRRITFAARPL